MLTLLVAGLILSVIILASCLIVAKREQKQVQQVLKTSKKQGKTLAQSRFKNVQDDLDNGTF